MPMLQHELAQQGSFLFRHRGILPLLFLVPGIGLYVHATPPSAEGHLVYFTLSLVGLLIRMATKGFAPLHTSGRNVLFQKAQSLNTTGMYSIIRHPLYLGNFFIWLGCSFLIGHAWFSIIFILAFWLYYERIMMAEEVFLLEKFGDAYSHWAMQTPAFIPGWKRPSFPSGQFLPRRIFLGEKNGILALALIFCLFDVLPHFLQNGFQPPPTSGWVWLLVASTMYYLMAKIQSEILKKKENEGS
ncbi:MAG: DUF1295 domain-containing protein [Cyclobacteriaceae bacterium]|nr:DUF1295 domain-containing protein [Cyclobacteriaceae bacterium]